LRRLSQNGRKLQEDYSCEYDTQGLDSSTCCDAAGICAADLWDCMEIVDFSKVPGALQCELYMSWDSINDPDMQNPSFCDVWIYDDRDGWIDGTCDQFLTGFGDSGSGSPDDCWVWLENIDCMADFDFVTGLTACQYSIWYDSC